MKNSFKGIEEKLNRADENIVNLNSEIDAFFQACRYPTLPKNDDEALLEAIEYHKNLAIPPRFSVLVGEIIHHLRSCLDHVVWQFSSDEYRRDSFWKIEFPVFSDEPIEKDALARYKGKVKGITNPDVLGLINDLQPYNAPDAADAPIWIIHDMDIVDKHRELILCPSTVRIEIPASLWPYADYDRSALPPEIEDDLYHNLKVVPQISFKNFGRREIQPVVPALKFLHSVVGEIVERFEGWHSV
jgi:hypothetical protein